MFKKYLLNNSINNYKDLYKYVKEKVKKNKIYLLLDEVQNYDNTNIEDIFNEYLKYGGLLQLH